MVKIPFHRLVSTVLAPVLGLSLSAAVPVGAGAHGHDHDDDHGGGSAHVTFGTTPDTIRAGRTVPLQFTVTGADGTISATVTAPDGQGTELDLRAGPRDRYITLVSTEREMPGYYEVAVRDGGEPIGTVAFPAFGGPPGKGADVTLLHDTHFHGAFHHDADTGVSEIAQYMALVEERKDALPHALFTGNGDDIAPSLLAGVFHGEHMIEALNASPLDVDTFGNHDFDFGPENLRERIAESEFPWVTANVRDIDSGEPFAADLGVEPFMLVDVQGVDVGITGLGPENMADVTSLGPDTEQIPAIDAMEEVVPDMRDAGADLVVVTSHLCGPDARELAATVDGIDAIVGDHCAEVLEQPEIINDTLVSFVGDEFDLLGELRMQVEDGEIVDHHFTSHELPPDIAPSPEVQHIVDTWETKLDEAFGEVIGFRLHEWDVRAAQVRSTETGFANYIADTIRMTVDADVALQNGGGIRSDRVFPAETDITRRDVIDVLPFPNTVVMVEVDGATILEALEHGVSRVEAGDGRFPQVSGMRYVWDPDGEPRDPENPESQPGERIVDVTIGGEPLDPDATYTLATNDFLLGGGDGYAMLADGEVLVGPGEGRLLSEVVTDRIVSEGEVESETDGRISRVE
ncbi:bifunctional metallophosphatase/5'-nucleotidase [Actinobacteria bacterium YIM 96077]|nr:5'-nucleotidase C-terminal domain-containing protein [Phytoactinopolyspora halophila]AYY12392.1 bifunctional metallophosphatase/5'-nucleotidase [Actinobacteria bacterium YIM 96077]